MVTAASGTRFTLARARSTWVWHVDELEALVPYAVSAGVSEVFAHVPWQVDEHADRERLRRAIDRCRAEGLRVQALGGAADWVDKPRDVVKHWLQPLRSTLGELPIHLDVEPAFSPGRPELIDAYVVLLAAVSRELHGAPLDVDVGHWWHHPEATGGRDVTQLASMIAATITVMAYRRHPHGDDGAVTLALPAVTRAVAARKRFRIGQETRDLGPDPDQRKQTHFGTSIAEFNESAASIDTAFRDVPGYLTIAVHDWPGYRALFPGSAL